MEKIAGLGCSSVTQKRLFQRSSLPPSITNYPFISFHSHFPNCISVIPCGKEERINRISVLSADPPGLARTWRKQGKGTPGEPASRTRGEEHGRHHHLTSQPSEYVSNLVIASKQRDTQPFKRSGFGKLEVSLLSSPHFSICDSPLHSKRSLKIREKGRCRFHCPPFVL